MEAIHVTQFDSLRNSRILDRFKLKAIADDKLNTNQNLNFVFERVEKIVGTVENAVNQVSFLGL